MGVYIKGMKKPVACAYCELLRYDYGVYVCPLLDKEIARWAKNPKYCPLVEVKTPHGRLVDAGELLKWADANPLTEDGGIDINEFEEYLNNAPTIIEAEEGEAALREEDNHETTD